MKLACMAKRRVWPGISALMISVMLVTLVTGCGLLTPAAPVFNEQNPGIITFEITPVENLVMNPQTGLTYANNEILVVASPQAKYGDIEKLAETYEAEIVGYIEVTGDYQWRLRKTYTEAELNALIEALNNDPVVAEATLNLFSELQEDSSIFEPNDPEWEGQWDDIIPAGPNWGVEAIRAPWAWKFRDQMKGTAVNVGLLDGEFDTDHEDLHFTEVFFNPAQEQLTDAHGTHVAGTFAAGFNNDVGITGIYPWAEGHLYGVSCSGIWSKNSGVTAYAWKAAFAELIVRNVKVINVSLGYEYLHGFLAGKGYTEVQEDINQDAKILGDFLERLLDKGYDFVIVAGAGNTANKQFKQTGTSDEYPYGWEPVSSGGEVNKNLAQWGSVLNAITNAKVHDRIIVVGAAELKTNYTFPFTWEKAYSLADLSNGGSRVDIIAPGVNITSTILNNEYEGGWEGTSMAAPHVTGAAAMLWSFNPKLTGTQVRDIIIESGSSSSQYVEGTDKGMVQALYCLAIAGGKQGSSNANVSTPQNAVAISLVCTSEQERLQDAAVEAINSATGVSAGSAKTDEEGRFELILPAGTYQLNVSAAGYSDAQVKDITVRNGEVFYLDWIVLPTPLKDFTIPKDMTLTIGETEVIEPDTDPDGATGYNLHWTSSDASVATVSPEGAVGIITSKAKGSTVITASLALGGQTISKSTNVRVASQGRDTVLVLDVSGSMNGDPLREMKASAINFCHELLADAYNNRVGLVYYDSDVAAFDLTNDVTSLITKINSLSAGSMTNMEGGLAAAKEMMDAQGKADYIKNIVVMADGLPNAGKTSNSGSFQSAAYASSGYYHAVIDTALSIKRSYHLYSLGFFHSLANKDDALALMQQIAMSDQDFYIVDQAENLQFAFGDIAESISNGAKIVINIACPVDAAVTYQGEQLNSAANQYADHASFGTLKLLGKNQDIKVFSLDADKDYEVALTGTDVGTMDYSVNYLDDQENLTDYRSFSAVPITAATKIQTATEHSGIVALNVDEDGDGVYDSVWEAGLKQNGSLVSDNKPTPEPEPIVPDTPENSADPVSDSLVVVIMVGGIIVLGGLIALVAVISSSSRKRRKRGGVPPTPETKNGSIVILSGSMAGMSFAVNDGETLSIGRGSGRGAQVVLTDDAEYELVSRLHCTISYNQFADRYFVTDCSNNGTFTADHVKLEPAVSVAFASGSLIVLADDNCQILLK